MHFFFHKYYNQPLLTFNYKKMYSTQDQLTELVRRLEEKNHIFSADPILITEKLQPEQANPLTKLHRRATRIDNDGKLAQLLTTIDTRVNGVIWGDRLQTYYVLHLLLFLHG